MDFPTFFHKATDNEPFPYQQSLASADLSRLALAAPTGAGKTAAAVLAWLWQRTQNPAETPTRLVLCEPQRTLVEQLYKEVTRWLENLELAKEIELHPMQGGYIDEAWELHPEKPAIIIGTQDQLLSRALNRGYAMSRFRWPVHFGLFHNDVQWVFDEIQLMGPALETSAQLHGLRQKLGFTGTARTLWMSATLHRDWLNTVDHPADDLPLHPFTEDDKIKLGQRLNARKPLEKLDIPFDPKGDSLAKEIARLHLPGKFTLVIVNTVKRAVAVHARLVKQFGDRVHLLHSRFRSADRKDILQAALQDGTERIVVSTQVIEAGVDLSADILITELAPRSAMIQRFGRCNRRGEQDHAQVYWVDVPEKHAAPYEPEDLERARTTFAQLHDVPPAHFLQPLDEPRPLYDTLRKRDLLDLFDTTSDLSGLDIDISRFIRDGDNRDVFVFWRNWYTDRPPLEMPAAAHHELCKVGKFELAKRITDKKLEVWYLDDLTGIKAEWRQARANDLVSGRTYLVNHTQGHYSPKTGWDPDSKAPVAPLEPKENYSPFPAMADDSRSGLKRYLTLEQHTSNVCDEMEAVTSALQHLLPQEIIETLKTSALWHDVGKAHPVFQATMRKHIKPEEDDPAELWAKCVHPSFHNRRYFRHELASALAARAHGLSALTQYLTASHHGKARLSVRSFPDEENNAILGIIEGDVLPPIPPLLPDPTELSLKAFVLGRGGWQDQALKLRDDPQLGPFRLAYLEALMRAADVRASKKESNPESEVIATHV